MRIKIIYSIMVGWFEIPVTNMERVVNFYETVFALNLKLIESGGVEMALFPPSESQGISGSLIHYEQAYTPSNQGVLIYFSSPSGDLKNEEARIESAGGKILLAKRMISAEFGYMNLFEDTEGNRLALHSRN